MVQLIGCADLLDIAVLHHHDAVGQGHGLGLVVGDVDGGRAGLLVDLGDFIAHGHALLGVQVGKRLVHQEDAHLADDGAADGHALALAAGQRPGQAVQVIRQAQDLRRLVDPLFDDLLVHALKRQAKGDVVVHRHLGVQGVALEHHGNLPLPGAHLVGAHAIDQEFAVGNILKAGNHAQGGRFATARRPHEHDKFTLFNLKIEVVHRVIAIRVNLVDVLQR